ncbi:hypothetical protein [Nocardia sp. XZ_19_385]|uniref:hypothetical protein n=1 Tax=Nocardia sp. XZ_19_385 TaxID=2769488 RepID=UPI00188E3611|nr:hypothetical protein [Nocardia sp. XZ_19_385]
MTSIMRWAFRYADVLVALTLALVVVGLDVIGETSEKTLQNAMMATLAVVALVLLRDRVRTDSARDETRDKLDALVAGLDSRQIVQVISGAECSRLLAQARLETRTWVFKGATATYVRAVTLPDCIRIARPNQRALAFQLEILDPTNESLCARYVDLHKSMSDPSSPVHQWDADGTQRELFSTILAACWYQQQYARLAIEIRLSSSYTLARYELAADKLILTQRGPGFPATVVHRDTPTYDCLEKEVDVSWKQARQVPLQAVKQELTLSPRPTPDEVKRVFATLALPLPATWNDAVLTELSDMALASPDPYA